MPKSNTRIQFDHVIDWLKNWFQNLLRNVQVGNNNTQVNIEIVIKEAAKSRPEVRDNVIRAATEAACKAIEKHSDKRAAAQLKHRITKAMRRKGKSHAAEFDAYIQRDIASKKVSVGKPKGAIR